MPFFQMVPIPLLSVSIYSARCEYDILKVLLKKIDHNLPVGRVEHDNQVPGGISYWILVVFQLVFITTILLGRCCY
jgi:hypothetical protein